MSTDVWSMVSALIAAGTFLPLMYSQPCQRLVTSTLWYIGSAFFPSAARCETLMWEDVPNGPLHTCQSTNCSHWPPSHSRSEKCWKPVTEFLFTGPSSGRRKRKHTKKPKTLEFFGSSYLCVDVRLLAALILCSIPPEKSIHWREGARSYDDDVLLDIRNVEGDLLVVHFKGKLKQQRVLYKNKEITALLNGYPPWYREKVVCAHGPEMPFPIHSPANITRGGWIIAVGLRDYRREPMALYVVPNTSDHQKDGSYSDRTNGSHLRAAVERVYRALVDFQQEYIQSSNNLDTVIAAIGYLIQNRTGSGVERMLPGLTVSGGQVAQLDAAQCIFAMSLFNKPVWSDADIQNLRPILAPVLQASFTGCYQVIQYLKDTGFRLVLPQAFGDDWTRKIYLRDCVVGEV